MPINNKMIMLIIIIIGCYYNSAEAKTVDIMAESNYFKNYALAICIAKNYQDGIQQSAITVLNRNRFSSSLPLNAYHALNQRLEHWQERLLLAKQVDSIQLQNCFNFKDSTGVSTLFKRYSICLELDKSTEAIFRKSCL